LKKVYWRWRKRKIGRNRYYGRKEKVQIPVRRGTKRKKNKGRRRRIEEFEKRSRSLEIY